MKKIFESKKSRIVAIALLVLFLWKLDVPNFIKSIHPQKGDFVKVGKMSVPRYGHEAILLDDGTVLIYGGAETAANPEIYAPKTKKFTHTGELSKVSGCFNPITINNGKILLTGGGSDLVKETQLYSPRSKKFEKGPEMTFRRNDNTATLLKDGRVLITGGGFRLAKESEIYDPVKNKFKVGPKTNIMRFESSAILLKNGRVLIIGGFGIGPKYDLLSSAEIYDPNTNKFELAGNMKIARRKPNVYLLKNGNVLISGGVGEDNNKHTLWRREIEIYNPRTNEFKIIAKRKSEPDMPSEVLLNNDKLLFTGGSTGVGLSFAHYKSSEIFDPKTNKFIKGKDMNILRAGHRMTLLEDGNVLISGREGSGRTAELYINR